MTTLTEEVMKLYRECRDIRNEVNEKFRGMLLNMVDLGLAKVIEEEYGISSDMIIVGSTEIMYKIHYYSWDDESDPEFWSDDGIQVFITKGELEWF